PSRRRASQMICAPVLSSDISPSTPIGGLGVKNCLRSSVRTIVVPAEAGTRLVLHIRSSSGPASCRPPGPLFRGGDGNALRCDLPRQRRYHRVPYLPRALGALAGAYEVPGAYARIERPGYGGLYGGGFVLEAE